MIKPFYYIRVQKLQCMWNRNKPKSCTKCNFYIHFRNSHLFSVLSANGHFLTPLQILFNHAKDDNTFNYKICISNQNDCIAQTYDIFAYFFNLLIYFNWKLITLQYFGSFAIHWHQSAMGVHVSPNPKPPPTTLPTPSFRVVPVHRFEYPVLCIKLGLVIYFTYCNTYVSVLFSQIITPLHSPTESKGLFFISGSLLLSHI